MWEWILLSTLSLKTNPGPTSTWNYLLTVVFNSKNLWFSSKTRVTWSSKLQAWNLKIMVTIRSESLRFSHRLVSFKSKHRLWKVSWDSMYFQMLKRKWACRCHKWRRKKALRFTSSITLQLTQVNWTIQPFRHSRRFLTSRRWPSQAFLLWSAMKKT